MDIFLPSDLETFIKREVESGRYNSSSEVVAEALRLLSAHTADRAADVAEFERELTRRIASADAGEFVDPAAVRLRAGCHALLRRRIQVS